MAIETYWIKTSIHTIRHASVVSSLRVVQLSDLYLQTFDRRWAKVVEEVERFNLDPEIAVFDFLLKRHTF